MRIIFIFVIIFIGCETDTNISIQLAHQSLGDPDVLFLDVRTRQEFINEGRYLIFEFNIERKSYIKWFGSYVKIIKNYKLKKIINWIKYKYLNII